MLPPYLNLNLIRVHDVHKYYTRQNNDIHLKRTNLKKSMNCLFYKGMNDYNKLPSRIKDINSLNSFKRNLSAYFKSL